MKKLFTIFAAVLLTATLCAQSPEKISYQAVIRNSSDALVTNKQIGMRISILQGSESGTGVYTETQRPTTNANGLASIEIGGGTVVGGDFSTINWANGPYFIKTETDITGGASYTVTGTSQLLNVPYALHAKTTETLNYLTIGQAYQGGIIFWLDASGQHGLIAAPVDQSITPGMEWFYGSLIAIPLTNAVGVGVGAGMYNTERIIAKQGIESNYAAQACANYKGGGYGDWYLPSKDELNLLYQQKNAVGFFFSADYWSSTESTEFSESAWAQNFGNGAQFSELKVNTKRVRAIRAF